MSWCSQLNNYHATLIDISRFLHGKPGDRVEVAYLLAEFVTADPLLLETVTRLRIAASPAASPGKLYDSTTAVIETVDHLGNLTHDQLTIAHHLATTWLDGPAALATEAKIRSIS